MLLMLIACRADPTSSFTLELQPRVPDVVDPFGGAPQVSLIITDRAAGTEIHDLGPWTGAALRLPKLGPLDQAMVGILVQVAGTDGSEYHPEAALAWGEAGPISLALETEPVTLPLALPMIGRTGILDNLDDGDEALYTAAAMLPDGTVLRFGGGRDLISASRGASDAGASLGDLDAGDWAFHDVGGAPDFDEDGAPDLLSAATATAFTVEGEDFVVVAGGRDYFADIVGSAKWLAVFKPSTGAWVQVGNGLKSARSQHKSMVMSATGNVLIMGGIQADGSMPGCSDPERGFGCSTFEIFDAEDWKTEQFGDTFPLPPVGFAMADLGSTGVLVCGGGDFFPTGGQYTAPVANCAIVGPNGDVTVTADMPVPVQAHAMSTLADGRVLATGGSAEDCVYGATCFATNEAWIYDPEADAWSDAAPLNTPRLQHAQLTMADGRVLLVGGAQGGGPVAPDVKDALDCNEVFDPSTGEFTVLTPCDAPPLGADPTVAGDPARGWVVFEGAQEGGSGGGWYGIVGGSPSLPPE